MSIAEKCVRSPYRGLEIAAVVVFAVAWGWLAADVVVAVRAQRAFFLPIPIAMGAYLAADVLSGVVHWAADTFGTEATFLVGPKFIKNFREHHVDPKGITRHDFVETNGDNCLVSLTALLPTLAWVPRSERWGLHVSVFVLALLFFVWSTNQIHKWAHSDAPPRVVRILQRTGLVLSPEHHDVHHTAPHDRHYCITTGWMNPVLEKVRFFRVAERLIRACTGARTARERSETVA